MKKILLILVAIIFAANSFAQANEVTLPAIGTGENEEKATLQALRSAIEQTFGAFVSANTTILNDEIVQDEIVSISTGNVTKYEKNAVITLPNGHISVSLNATVAINKLMSYAQSKGIKAEFAGASYATNAKLLHLKIQSIQKACEILVQQLEHISQEMFDFELTLPPLPSRVYEVRVGMTQPATFIGVMIDFPCQVYIDGKVEGDPFRVTYLDVSSRWEGNFTGYVPDDETYDNGLENDKFMRLKGWMKAPMSLYTTNSDGYFRELCYTGHNRGECL